MRGRISLAEFKNASGVSDRSGLTSGDDMILGESEVMVSNVTAVGPARS